MYIKSLDTSSWATLLSKPSAQNVPFRQKLKVKVKSKSKCMENVWEKIFNWIFQNEATVGFKFDVHQSCRARGALIFFWRPFSHPFSKFWVKLKINSFIIENVLAVTLSSTFESQVSFWAKNFLKQKTQLVKLYKNSSGVNYLAYSYSDFISVVTTFIFIFDFNIV